MTDLPSLYLFNPENDMALASGQRAYTPGKQVDIFRNDASMLPIWYADDGGYVLSSVRDEVWMEQICRDFNLTSSVVDRWAGGVAPKPWGWSANAVWQYEQKGVDVEWLPTPEDMIIHRQQSHRRMAARLLQQLKEYIDYPLPEVAVEAYSMPEVIRYAEQHPDGFYMKAPWSSSGRGVMDSRSVMANKLLEAASGVLKRQGSVMLEPRLERVLDFAILYHRNNRGLIKHCGYSVFSTSLSGNYVGNIVASDDELERRIAVYVGPEIVWRIAHATEQALNDIMRCTYSGYLGVDMMVYRDVYNRLMIYPAVEINLRMTMGVVAWKLARHIMAPGCTGIYTVACAPNDKRERNYVAENGRLVSGTVSMLPPSSRFKISLMVD